MPLRFIMLLLLGFALARIPHALAQPPTLIIPHLPPSNEETQQEFTRLLKPTEQNDISFTPIVADDLPPGTHLRIVYESRNVVPIEFGVLRTHPFDLLAAVLPAAERGDVLLPLTPSPSWNSRDRGVFLKVYGLTEQPPRILRLGVEDRATFPRRIGAYVRHPFAGERFSFYTMSELAGYRVGGVPVSVVLGAGMVLVVILSYCHIVRKRAQGLWKILPCTILVFLLLYEARFLLDVGRSAAAHQTQWRAERRYGHMGMTYAVADALRREVKDAPEDAHILLCSHLATPYRYLLYPTPLSTPDQPRPGFPTHAVVTKTWDRSADTIRCAGESFSGTILVLFPDGEAAVRLTHPFQAGSNVTP